jgi:hypothetical protein
VLVSRTTSTDIYKMNQRQCKTWNFENTRGKYKANASRHRLRKDFPNRAPIVLQVEKKLTNGTAWN